jgi:hypothetical protein
MKLYRTATGQRLHLPECPHVLGVALFEADEGDAEVCSWCRAELSGEGRTYFDEIEDALREMGAAETSVPVLARHLRTVEHDTVYVPNSRSYTALGKDGLAVAVAGHTYVWFREAAPVYLPDFVGSQRDAGNEVRDAWGDTCDVHFVKRSLTGVCEGCL